MPRPVISLESVDHGFAARVWREVVGLAQDYWKDGGAEKKPKPVRVTHHFADDVAATDSLTGTVHDRAAETQGLWHALPGEISERMFGEGFVTAGGEELATQLTHPLGLSKEMNVLDLSAGLGAQMRKTSKEFGVYITGLEPDPGVAARGMELSIRAGKGKQSVIMAYDPADFSVPHRYDCILSRETFYRVVNKDKLFGDLAACSKPKAQLSFTDYVLEPSLRDDPAIAAWMRIEKGATPFSPSAMSDAWARHGFAIRVREDKTDYYQREVLKGLRNLADFIAHGHKPDEETRKSLERRLNTWAHRLAALKAGVRFYRFYGVKTS